jgi:exonuclease 3'-5' domain-containing protein 1
LTEDLLPLLAELCEEQVEHFIRRDSVRLKKKSRKAEVEIQELREKMGAVAPGKTLVLSNREIRLLRYMDLTDEEKEKLEGSQKVLKKLERIQNKNENRQVPHLIIC